MNHPKHYCGETKAAARDAKGYPKLQNEGQETNAHEPKSVTGVRRFTAYITVALS